MRGIVLKFAVLVSAIFLLGGCTSQGSTSTNVSTSDNGNISVSQSNETDHLKTVKTFVENELTTTKELKEAFHKMYSDKATDFNQGAAALNDYLKAHYGPIIPEDEFQTFINTNEGLLDLMPAYFAGYELKPTHIEIKNVDKENMAYTFKAEVEYAKGGKTNTSTITGYINLNADGKIAALRDFNDKELQKIFTAENAKEGRAN